MDTFYNVHRHGAQQIFVSHGTITGELASYGPFDDMDEAFSFIDLHKVMQTSQTTRIFNQILEEVNSDFKRFDEHPSQYDKRVDRSEPQFRPCRKEIRRYMFEIQGRSFGSGGSSNQRV